MKMTLNVDENLKSLNDNIEPYQGFFITENGRLCYKPDKHSNTCYYCNTGEQFEYDGSPVYEAYFVNGTLRKVNWMKEERDSTLGGKRKSHPSYGMISFHKTQCSPVPLFGSSIKHGNPIRLTIKHADIDRHLNNDWYYGNGIICEIEMSNSQFAEAITSMNTEGVPCTVLFTEQDGTMPRCDYVSKVEQFQDEFKQSIANKKSTIDDGIKEITQLFEERKTLRKQDKEKILSILNAAKADYNGNTSFIYNQFNEQMNNTVKEAKGEIEAFMEHQIRKIASNAIAEKMDKDGIKALEEGLKNPVEM